MIRSAFHSAPTRPLPAAFTCLLLLTSLSACRQPAIKGLWYDSEGRLCNSGSPYPGCTYHADGSRAKVSEDPDGFYYLAARHYDTWYYINPTKPREQVYMGFGWKSDATGVIYDADGVALNAVNESQNEGRDILADTALQEEQILERAGKELARQNPALTESQGIRIMNSLHAWDQLQGSGRTDEELAAFSARAFGISAERAKATLTALEAGDESRLETLNREIARHWSTDPETSRQILKDWLSFQ